MKLVMGAVRYGPLFFLQIVWWQLRAALRRLPRNLRDLAVRGWRAETYGTEYTVAVSTTAAGVIWMFAPTLPLFPALGRLPLIAPQWLWAATIAAAGVSHILAMAHDDLKWRERSIVMVLAVWVFLFLVAAQVNVLSPLTLAYLLTVYRSWRVFWHLRRLHLKRRHRPRKRASRAEGSR